MSDIAIYIHTDDGKIHDIDAPADIKVQDCVKELVSGLQLSATDRSGHAIDWCLVGKSTGKALEPSLTLEQNGVRTEETLYLRAKPHPGVICSGCGVENVIASKFCKGCGRPLNPPATPSDVTVHIVATAGRNHSAELPLALKAGELLTSLIDNLELATKDPDGVPIPFYLLHQETSIALDPEKSLQQNGVHDGDHLCVRAAAVKRQPAPPPEKPAASRPRPMQIKAKAVIAIALGLMTLMGIAGFLRYGGRTLSLTVTPGASILWTAQQQQFKASFSDGKNQALRWSIDPAIGSISSQGIYTAPSSLASDSTIRVTATSASQPELSASATIMLHASGVGAITQPAEGSPVTVTLTPAAASLWALEHQKFRARVDGSSNTAVRWSVDPDVGTISASGVYTAPYRTMARRYVRITATSQADSTKSAAAIVTLKPSIAGK